MRDLQDALLRTGLPKAALETRRPAASNYVLTLKDLRRFEEVKSLLRKTIPVARRVLGEGHDTTLRMKWDYADVLCEDPAATLDDLNEAVTTIEETAQTARRVLGGAHPDTAGIERRLLKARAALRARGGDVEAMPPGDA